MTTLVHAYFVRKGGFQFFYLQHIYHKLCKLIYFFADACCCCFVLFIMQMFFNVQGATSRRANNVIKCCKIFYKKFIAAFGQFFKTGVGHGLTAAGLI